MMRQKIDSIPQPGDIIIFDSSGMFPDIDGIDYEVMPVDPALDSDIITILKLGKTNTKENRTQTIAKFSEGYNPYLYFKKKINRVIL